MKISKVIYQSWSTRKLHPIIQNKINIMMKLNPSYDHHIFTDKEIDKFVKKNYDKGIVECYNKLNIIVAKVDFWRYLLLYKYGGIYLDMDSTILKPLDELINNHDEAIITAEGNPNLYVQWALIFSKNHPI